MQKDKIYRLINRFWDIRRSKYYTFKFDVIEKYAKTYERVNFIQIGSNDGITKDPIHKYITSQNWEGVLVEPVPYLFQKLKLNYSEYEERLSFENSAISNSRGIIDFYRLKESEDTDLPWFYDQLGSFRKDIILKHRNLIPGFDDLLIKDSVNGITFSDLLVKHYLKKVDLIHIDTEGFDFEIIKMIPFRKLKVKILMYEHKHLSASDYKKSILTLSKRGFIVGALVTEPIVKDTIAIKKDVFKRLLL